MFERVTRSRAVGRAFLQFHGWLAAMAAHAAFAYGLTAMPRADAAPDESMEVATYLFLQAPEPPSRRADVPPPPMPQDPRAVANRPARAPGQPPRRSEHLAAGAADPTSGAELLAPRWAELALATVPRTLDLIPPSGLPLDSALLRGLGDVAPAALAGSAADAAAPGEADAGGVPVVEAAVFASPPRLLNRFLVRRLMGNDYPPRLQFRGIEGQVVVAFIIGVDGRPEMEHVQVLSATHADFIPAALRGLRGMRFRPAHFDGRSVRVRVSLPMVWTLPADG